MAPSINTVMPISIGNDEVKYDKPSNDLLTFVMAGILPKITSSNIGTPKPASSASGGRKTSLVSLSNSLRKAARGVLATGLFILF
jgi:hypothetical protein